MNKAIFLDKDGTLIWDIPYNADPALIQLQERLINGLQKLKKAGFLLVVITNQSGIARGYFPESEIKMIKDRVNQLLQSHNLSLDGFFYCPHHPKGNIPSYSINCDCRKPAPGMLFQAAEQLHINLAGSWMIGDILNDVEAGNRAGCRTILINNGHETRWKLSEKRVPDLIADSIDQAADLLLITDKILALDKNMIPIELS